jgi:hypothetical protein
MIVGHLHRFIFIKTNKTAGTSLEIALSEICGENDIVTQISPEDELIRKSLGFCTAQNYIFPEKKILFRAHTKAIEIKEFLGDEIWNSYYKFCFERNPWDKVISHYYWRGGDERFSSIGGYIKAGELAKIKAFNHYSDKGEIIVDKVFSFENLENALNEISTILNLLNGLKMPEYQAKSGFRKDFRTCNEIFKKEEADYVSKVFKREIDLMNYKL